MHYVSPDGSNFEKQLSSGRWIVFHHMNGCLHCMLFRPTWKQAVAICKNCDVNVAECEYSDMKRLPSSMQQVMGFPTIMVYENTKPVAEFEGIRSVENVTKFLKTYDGRHLQKSKSSAKPRARASTAKPRARTSTAKPKKTRTIKNSNTT